MVSFKDEEAISDFRSNFYRLQSMGSAMERMGGGGWTEGSEVTLMFAGICVRSPLFVYVVLFHMD